MDYVITFSDVMAGVVTLAIGTLGFFIRGWLKGIQTQIKENDNKVNQRIDKLEEKTNADIENIKKDVNGIKGEFSTTFVLREDFFRATNSMDDSIRKIDNKMDRLLMSSSERRG